MRPSIILAAFVTIGGALAAPTPARADHDDWRAERRARRDERRLADDHFDYVRLRDLLTRFDAARARNHYPELVSVERELVQLVDEELRESERELQREQREAIRAQNTGNRRIVVITDNGRPRVVRSAPRTDKETRDAWREANQLERKRTIAMQLHAVAGRQDPAALDYRRGRMIELLSLGGRELNRDRRELEYDRRGGGWYGR